MQGAPPPLDRNQILKECIAESANWKSNNSRNIVMLFDGTGNILGNAHDTNVVKLLRMLDKDRCKQLVYYDPGVGTNNEFPPLGFFAGLVDFFKKLGGLALGRGAYQNIAAAYEYLILNFQEGDRIFVFGFSRGAFTARALAGMINMYGLMYSAGLPLIKILVSTYFSPDSEDRRKFAGDVRKNFSLFRKPLIYFTGVWDTVETIGSGFLGGVQITNPPGVVDKRFVHVRHALAMHETRCKYRPRRYIPPNFTTQESPYRSFDERWFRGVHSDIGGSYVEDGLSNITLNWMVEQSSQKGLLFADRNAGLLNGNTPLHDETYGSPLWAWTGLDPRARRPDDVIDPSAMPIGAAVPAASRPLAKKRVAFAFAAYGAFFLAAAVRLALESRSNDMLLTDAALFLAFLLWIAYPVTSLLRLHAQRAILKGNDFSWIPRNAQWLMLASVVLVGAWLAVSYLV